MHFATHTRPWYGTTSASPTNGLTRLQTGPLNLKVYWNIRVRCDECGNF